MNLRLSPKALLDLEDIWVYLAQNAGEDTATMQIDMLQAKFRILVQFPYLGKGIPEARSPVVRSFPAAPYVIFYSVKSDQIQILRVLHASRDPWAFWGSQGAV